MNLSLIEKNPTLRLGRKARLMPLVLQYFHSEGRATTEIAVLLDISEQEVCDLLDEADRGR
ncbi:hypothetical protein HGO38_01405 [Rhizobium sp. CG5]|uniref:hypothetical protein n=1 Tax=Rhizobium sp. CG5 TaxID=2726076 RepID=UPI0020346F51|nr:hypothetical protein [Rhizobium sp. CG5]MCM2472132.1 hypothetical protein [Rhizobium sp. CG5]